MCSERDSPLKRLYRRTHAKLTRLAGSGQLVWAADCELSLALVHARRPAWPGETSETILRVAPPRKTRPPDHTRVNWPVDASASGSAQVGPGGRHRWAARVQVGQEPARQKAREGYPSHYTSLFWRSIKYISIFYHYLAMRWHRTKSSCNSNQIAKIYIFPMSSEKYWLFCSGLKSVNQWGFIVLQPSYSPSADLYPNFSYAASSSPVKNGGPAT